MCILTAISKKIESKENFLAKRKKVTRDSGKELKLRVLKARFQYKSREITYVHMSLKVYSLQ